MYIVIVYFLAGCSGRHECLVPVTLWCAGLFEYLLENSKQRLSSPAKFGCRYAPYSTHLTVSPACLVLPEVEEYSRQNPREEPLVDPSSEVFEVTLLLLTWYRLFRRCDQAKDVKELQELGDLKKSKYLNLPDYCIVCLNLSEYLWISCFYFLCSYFENLDEI